MNYIYHKVPENMVGNKLYPLNRLKDVFPDLYNEQVKKYEGRIHVMDYKIPPLNCLWNDVLHFVAVDPKETKKNLEEARGKSISKLHFYKIDPNLLDPDNTVVYKFDNIGPGKEKRKEDFVPYNPKEISNLSVFPEVTKNYYKQAFNKGKRPLIYIGIPHILYKGTLDVSEVSIIDV